MSARYSMAALALLVLAAGCSSAPPKAPVHKEAGTFSAPAVGVEAQRLILPFDAYAMTTPDIHTIEAAEDVMIRDCMGERGMGWNALPRPSGLDLDPPNRRRYGLIESEVADRFGYHLPPRPPELARREAAWQARQRLPDREQLAAFGKDGAGGCWKRAHEALLQNVPQADQSLFNRRAREVFGASRRDRAVLRVFGEWSACMKKKGVRYTSPLKAMGDAGWGTSTRPSPREISVARSDVRCKEETGLVAVWADVETRMQRDVIRRHPGEFRAWKAEKDQWLRAARRALGRG